MILGRAGQLLTATRHHRQGNGSAGDIAIILKTIRCLFGRDLDRLANLLIDELVGLMQQQQINGFDINVEGGNQFLQ